MLCHGPQDTVIPHVGTEPKRLVCFNRISPGKEDTFVLDFANDEDEILESCQPYYEQLHAARFRLPD